MQAEQRPLDQISRKKAKKSQERCIYTDKHHFPVIIGGREQGYGRLTPRIAALVLQISLEHYIYGTMVYK